MVIQAAQARNMGVMAEVASTPVWEGPSGSIPGAGTPNPTDYASFVTAVAKRYGTAISAYEIWNEPNYALSSDPIDPTAYAALLKAAYPAIKAVDPSATVVAGALGSVVSFGGVTMDPTTFVQDMLAAGAAGYFDALSFHPYQESLPFSQGAGVANSPLSQLNAIYQLMVQYGLGNEKIWISEFGASTTDVSQQTQADLIQNLLDTWQTLSYAGPVFIYTAQDGVAGADGYGIYNADWTPKLAVAVIQAAIKQYSSSVLGAVSSTVGGVVGGITSGVGSVAQSLANLLQSIGLALQGEFQQLGQAISAWFTAISSSLSGVLPASTPLAAKVPTAAVKAAAVTPKSTAAVTPKSAAAVTPKSTAATTPASASTASSGGPSSGTTGSGATSSGTTPSTSSPTSASATSPSTSGSTESTGSKTSGGSSTSSAEGTSSTGASGKSSASGTGKTDDSSGAAGARGDSSGKPANGDGAASGPTGKSDKSGSSTSDKTFTKGSHDGHGGSASGSGSRSTGSGH
ncbi:MAG: cellulase family glycosylhydrolase [Mycobacterium sp.]|nr:cellulase family glycosylhydrolase [Mycobacterium sp.]